MKRSKRYTQQKEKIQDKNYHVAESIDLIKDISSAKFDESIEIHLVTSADPKNADQQLRTVAELPHGTGKVVKILVFAEGDAAVTAKESGADFISDDEIIKKIEGGWLDFDVAIATPDQMSKIGKLGKYLGRKGLMPNPKTGTVVQPQNIKQAIDASRKGRTEVRLDSASVIHFNVGKSSFSADHLKDNLKSVIKTILDSKPEGVKGRLMKRASMSTSMGPGIQLDIDDLELTSQS
jgi:large subunit ribosomal protein L1